MKLPSYLKNIVKPAGSSERPQEERRQKRGRRMADRSLFPAPIKYLWAALVTVLVVTSTVIGDGSKHAATIDLLIRALTGVSIQPADTEDTSR